MRFRIATSVAVWLAGVGMAADWPAFRGPLGTGSSPEVGLARRWPDAGPPVLWSAKVGRGYASPAIVDGEVFLLDHDSQNSRDVLRVLDLETGRQKWTFEYRVGREFAYPGSRNTPTVDERRIYLVSPHGPVHCLDRKTREVLWKHDLLTIGRGEGPRAYPPRWGFTSNPALWDDLIILAPLNDRVGLVGVDKVSGEQRWATPRIGLCVFSHVTPYVTQLDGVDQVVILANEHGHKDPAALISGVDVRTGAVLWQTRTWQRYNMPIPQPVKVDKDKLLIGGGYTIGAFVLRAWREGPDWKTDFIVRTQNAHPHLHSPALWKDRLYVQSFDRYHQRSQQGLVCLTPDAQLKWRSGPKIDFDSGGLLAADDLVFVMNGRTGELSLVEATDEEFREIARAKVLDAQEGEAWAPLALSRGRLLVRDLTTLKCLDVSAARK